MNLHLFHRFEKVRLFEGVRIFRINNSTSPAERYIAAEGYICRKCGKKAARYIDVYGKYCNSPHGIPSSIRENVQDWFIGVIVDNPLTYGKRIK